MQTHTAVLEFAVQQVGATLSVGYALVYLVATLTKLLLAHVLLVVV